MTISERLRGVHSDDAVYWCAEAADTIDALVAALEKAHAGLDAGCTQYANRTVFGGEVPGDEQFPWVRLMQIGRDEAHAALARVKGEK